MSDVISPQGYHYGEDPKSDNPFWTDEDLSDEITGLTATASVSDTTGTPAVSVTKSISGSETNFDFAFSGIKGEKGDTGDQGPQGIQGIQGETGATGPEGPQGPQGPQGETGATGATGPQGEAGADGVSPVVVSTGSTESGASAGTITGADGTIITVYNGAQGATGATGPQGAQGETGATGATGPAGTDGISPAVVSTGNTGSGEIAGTITGANGVEVTIYNGAQGATGATGATGPQGPAGADADVSGLVSDVTMTNEDGVYTFSQTKDDVSSSIGTIEVPDVDTTNVLAEVTDSVVETTSGNYQNDYHTIKETEYNGTQNDVGTFRIARNQITALNSDGSFHMISQDGTESDGQISIPEGISFESVSSSKIYRWQYSSGIMAHEFIVYLEISTKDYGDLQDNFVFYGVQCSSIVPQIYTCTRVIYGLLLIVQVTGEYTSISGYNTSSTLRVWYSTPGITGVTISNWSHSEVS